MSRSVLRRVVSAARSSWWIAGVAAVLVIAFVVALEPGDALARVGGGQSFGGGGGGGGSGDDAVLVWILIEIARLLIWLTIEYPAVGIPLDIVFVVVVIVVLRWRSKRRRRTVAGAGSAVAAPSGARRPARSAAVQRASAVAAALKQLRREDPNFSRPLFLDFVQLLYTRAHEHRGSGKLDHLAPYLRGKVRNELAALGGQGPLRSVDHIVIGASRIIDVGAWDKPFRRIAVEIEANYTEHRGGGDALASHTLYVHERWIFRRDAGVLSKGPEDITTLRCPSCGSAVELASDGTCAYCHNVVDRGAFHWVVEAVQVVQRRPRSRDEMHLGGGVEVGTDLPTVVQPELGANLRALLVRDPQFTVEELEQRVRVVFMELQRAWSSMDWSRARAYETDHLFNTHRFWMEQYRAEGLRNVLDDIEIRKVELVKVEPDAFYDAVTVRIYASMIDVVIDGQGRVVEGSRTAPRVFTEYWTFIRRAGYRTQPDAEPTACPSCGAPVQVDQAGVCAYCETKVVTGEFGWVLSTIEQDEVYGG